MYHFNHKKYDDFRMYNYQKPIFVGDPHKNIKYVLFFNIPIKKMEERIQEYPSFIHGPIWMMSPGDFVDFIKLTNTYYKRIDI